MTALLRLEPKEVAQAGQLAFVMALAVANALQVEAGLAVRFKWSNDLLINGRKVAGILVETAYDAQMNSWALAGVGVNLLQEDFPTEIRGKATSVWLEAGLRLAVEPLAQQVLRLADQWMHTWREEGFAAIISHWRQRDSTEGQSYRLPSGEIGIARGVTDDGALLLDIGGVRMHVTSAEPVHGT